MAGGECDRTRVAFTFSVEEESICMLDTDPVGTYAAGLELASVLDGLTGELDLDFDLVPFLDAVDF